MKMHACFLCVACTLLLAGCAAGEGRAASSSAAPSVSTAAEPAATPEPTAEPSPEPTPAPTPEPSSLLEYTALPLDDTQKTPAKYWYYMTLHDDVALENARRLAEGLYSNDADAVRAACSDSVLTDTFPLNDLSGLRVTEFTLSGGIYEAPYLSLTVTDPGNTPFLRGRHEYYLWFDEDSKVDWLSLFPISDDEQSVTLASYRQSRSEDVSFWGITSAELTNPLGLTWGPASLQCYDAYWVPNEDDDGHHYENRSVQDLGTVEAPPYGITSYAVPPEGSVLTDDEAQWVCDSLNAYFAALADGSYTDEFNSDPGNDALLSGWAAAVPLPVAVTPESLRSCASLDNWDKPCTQIWVPLPQNCWAVIKTKAQYTGSEDVIDYFFAFNYYQTVPDALAAVLAQ